MVKRNHDLFSMTGKIYAWLTMGMIIAVCLFIILTVFWFGKDALSWTFLTAEPSASATEFEGSGILTPMIGTILLTLIGILIALPFSLATALYLCFYSKRGPIQKFIQSAIDILAGVPTVVIALFARAIFTLPGLGFLSTMVEVSGVTATKAYGKSFLVAGITMSVMILPFVIKAMIEALKTVPTSFYMASIGLGASKWRSLRCVVLQAARPGLVTGVILGMGRIIGDTAIVWLALGGTLRMTGVQPWYAPGNFLSTLQNTGSTLTSYIYYTSPAGEGNNYTVAFGASIVLIGIIILLNLMASIIGRPSVREEH